MKTIIYNRYEIGIGLGCWAKSDEYDTVREGDVRYIGGILMHAYVIRRKFLFKYIVSWCPIDDQINTMEKMKEWINKL